MNHAELMNVDYIIVGLGLSGLAFCEVLDKNDKSFVVIDGAKTNASQVAAGLYNPVVLKRFTLAWEADQQLQSALPFFEAIENKIQTQVNYPLPVLRVFNSVQEQNNWFEATDNRKLSPFLSDTILSNTNTNINATLGFGQVKQTGRIDVATLLIKYQERLRTSNRLLEELFDHSQLHIGSSLQYKNITAKKIVFAEGFGLKDNPFFNYLPLVGNKGELLTIKAPDLQLETVIKSSVFIIPLGDDIYKVGATYHWTDKTPETTQGAKEELIAKLKKLIRCDFEIMEQEAGVRPTVIDRKPLVGSHPELKNLAVLNGLGTRGVLIAPYVAPLLYKHLEHGTPLPDEISIERFLRE